MPPLHRHECSDKFPQCVQARRVRSEVCVLWRNSIPIMVEVMLLPDCCYGDETPPSDPISDPAIKQDALLLERWTLQPVPRQTGDKFIEEKTLLLAVRSYVFFSQLSAWLSASHGIVPRNILYRISAADEEYVCHFSQPPAEHLFPVPNVSQSVALKLRVQSLPRQPTYPTLACTIHTGLPLSPLYSKTPSLRPGMNPNHSLYVKSHSAKDGHNRTTLPFSGLPFPSLPSRPLPRSPMPSRRKAVRWLYSLTSDPSDEITNTTDNYGTAVHGAESSKGNGSEPLRAFKTYSLANPPRCPSPRPSSSETNPLIGSLLQERQEVIARIAQRLNFCDPTAPHLPPALFTPDTPTKTPLWGSCLDNTTLGKTKEQAGASPTEQDQHPRFDTPVNNVAVNIRETLSPKPAACRRLRLTDDRDLETQRDGKSNQARSQSPQNRPPSLQPSGLQDENKAPQGSDCSSTHSPATRSSCTETNTVLRSPSPLRPCNSWRNCNRHSLDSTLTKAFHPYTGLPLLSSPVPQRRSQTGYFDMDSSLTSCKGLPWTRGKRVCVKTEEEESEEPQQQFSASAPLASLSLLGNFEESVLNHRLEPLGLVDGFTAEVGASGTFCPSHMTFPVDVSFYSVSDDNAPSPYMGVINLETLGKRGYRVPSSGTIQVTLFNPNKTVVKMFVVVYDLRAMPSSHQTFLRQRTFSVPGRRDGTHSHTHGSRENTHGGTRKASLPLGQGRILRYLIHLRFQTSRSGKVYLHRDIKLLFSRKSMEVDSGAAYELKSYTESPADPAFSPRWPFGKPGVVCEVKKTNIKYLLKTC
ncbi:hypothetical protein DPEC_G00253590 [Dallia pectoralis]|uniref:Uncharacterized protein n=1 Tax=Dallia pectoralis TaxID=75939 RepID=A0ACC2FU16_DALPE|nr:hypothetical protein DPEC_G00253590 [Dallia pectoralis]